MSSIHTYEAFFYGKDILIDSISMLIILYLLRATYSYYKLDFQENKKHLIYSFVALAISFTFRIITHSLIYYTSTGIKHIGLITLTYQSITQLSTLIFITLTAYKVFALLGFYFLHITYNEKIMNKKHYALIILFVSILTYFSHYTYYIFHMLICILTILIAHKMFIKNKYKKRNNTLITIISFLLIGLSQGVFMLIQVNNIFYVIANIIQIIGYSTLLYQFLRVKNHGKKKRTN